MSYIEILSIIAMIFSCIIVIYLIYRMIRFLTMRRLSQDINIMHSKFEVPVVTSPDKKCAQIDQSSENEVV